MSGLLGSNPFGKTYHSQLPYKLGEKAAMKFRFVPNNNSSGDGKDKVNDTVAATRAALASGLMPADWSPSHRFAEHKESIPAKSHIGKAWTLEIQVHPDQVRTGHAVVGPSSFCGWSLF